MESIILRRQRIENLLQTGAVFLVIPLRQPNGEFRTPAMIARDIVVVLVCLRTADPTPAASLRTTVAIAAQSRGVRPRERTSQKFNPLTNPPRSLSPRPPQNSYQLSVVSLNQNRTSISTSTSPQIPCLRRVPFEATKRNQKSPLGAGPAICTARTPSQDAGDSLALHLWKHIEPRCWTDPRALLWKSSGLVTPSWPDWRLNDEDSR